MGEKMMEVELEWMVDLSQDVDYIGTLKEQLATEMAPAAGDHPPKVSLMYLGGRNPDRVAEDRMMDPSMFRAFLHQLRDLDGTEVEIELTHVIRDELCATSRVLLPDGLPCVETAFLTLTRSASKPESYALDLFQRCERNELMDEPLDPPVRLRGTVRVSKHERPQRKPRDKQSPQEATGQSVHVKKHSQLGCAVVTLPDGSSCQRVLARRLTTIQNAQVDIKQHEEKQENGTKMIVPNCIFCGWNKKLYTLTAEDLATFFDAQVAQP